MSRWSVCLLQAGRALAAPPPAGEPPCSCPTACARHRHHTPCRSDGSSRTSLQNCWRWTGGPHTCALQCIAP